MNNTSRSSSGTLTIVAAIAVGLVFGSLHEARGSISYSTRGSIYSENFDSLPTTLPSNANIQTSTPGFSNGWEDDTTTVTGDHLSVPGWYLYHPLNPGAEGGFNSHQRIRFGAGANTGSFWAFGSSASATDKALGSLGSATVAADNANMYMALRLVNNTGTALYHFTLTYDGEQWRDGQSASPETLSFAYSLTASTSDWYSTAAFNNVAALNFTSLVYSGTGSSGASVNGNVAGLTANITATIDNIDWEPGTELWLRWADPSLPSLADDGLAVDNVRFSAIPEPSTFALLGLGLAGIVARRRR